MFGRTAALGLMAHHSSASLYDQDLQQPRGGHCPCSAPGSIMAQPSEPSLSAYQRWTRRWLTADQGPAQGRTRHRRLYDRMLNLQQTDQTAIVPYRHSRHSHSDKTLYLCRTWTPRASQSACAALAVFNSSHWPQRYRKKPPNSSARRGQPGCRGRHRASGSTSAPYPHHWPATAARVPD